MEDPETLDQWQAYIETNLTAPFTLSQACIPYMKTDDINHVGEAGPCIINVSSFRAQQSDPDQEGYAASKAGQSGLTQAMAISAQRWGIRVNLVAPGRIKAAHECKKGDEKETKWSGVSDDDVDKHPANWAGTPEDVVDCVEYLIGAGFVTGENITIDGGKNKVKK
jgi:NAD(P)-dependent dehydrogenase (short-subunit alcohol dehydrogenase family)